MCVGLNHSSFILIKMENEKIIMSICLDNLLCSRSRDNLDKLYQKVQKKYKISTLG